MRLLWVLAFAAVIFVSVDARRKRKFEGDFEFADEDDNNNGNLLKSSSTRKKWIHDPDNELCRPLKCKKKEICLLDEMMTAFCVNKKQSHKNGDVIVPRSEMTQTPSSSQEDSAEDMDEDDDDVFYDPDDDQDEENVGESSTRCKPCPIVTPSFLCGSDNRTYSSLCRLDYHNCIHKTSIKVSCKGFCPCKETDYAEKHRKQADRASNLLAKFKNTVEREKMEKARNEVMQKKQSKINKTVEKKKRVQDKYNFVPEGFQFDNKQYKYLKYTKYNKPSSFKEDKEIMQNEVLDTYDDDEAKDGLITNDFDNNVKSNAKKQCSPAALQAMGDRLLDWFSVVMADSKRRRQKTVIKGEYPPLCKPETRFMHTHLDTDSDGRLSLAELFRLERDGRERCVKQFVDRCDVDGDRFVSRAEWCRCFEKSARPCARALAAGKKLVGSYTPDCDRQGFFLPTQCHAAVGMCWCVDKHGVEFANTRSRSRPNCESVLEKQAKLTGVNEESSQDDDDDDDDDEEDTEIEGSADQPLDF